MAVGGRRCRGFGVLLLLCLSGCEGAHDPVFLEFRIVQNTDLIRQSRFQNPPQVAIWLEDPESGRTRTLFVTRCSATGRWQGKTECPTALPRWFAVYRAESWRPALPRPERPAPDAVTRATPTAAEFFWRAAVAAGSRWICWVEVNLSADFNEHYPRIDVETGAIDTDSRGQPSLLYRCELDATPGALGTPKLYGRTVPGTRGEVSTELASITSARGILESIEIRVLH